MFILADDLTGAADTGVAFAKRGWRTVLRLKSRADFGSVDVTVVSSDSRALPEREAVARVHACLTQARLDGATPIYKKIDSVLRGHVAAELGACLNALHVDRALVAPAFPAQGRTTENGRQFVHGQALPIDLISDLSHHTSLPMRIAPLREGQVDEAALQHGLAQPGVLIADARTETHLDQIAAAGQRASIGLFCGSAGLAHALAGLSARTPVRQTSASANLKEPRAHRRPYLVVVGSQHPATRQQLVQLSQRNVVLVALSAERTTSAAAEAVHRCAVELDAGRSVALILPEGLYEADAAPALARSLGEVARQVIQQVERVPGLIMTGGDTALAVCSALEASAIELINEVEAGVPRGRLIGGLAAGAMVVTKSGGFGDALTLWRTTQAEL